jgi:hypothetical protein
MMRSAHKFPLFAMAASLLFVGAVLTSSCGEDGDSSGGDAEVLNAINILDKAGLHGLDEAINEDKEIPSNARTTAQQLQAITNLTKWPTDDLESQADALAKIFGELAAAVDGENPDLAKAGEAATRAHDAQHDFSHDVWEYLYEKGGVQVGGESHE